MCHSETVPIMMRLKPLQTFLLAALCITGLTPTITFPAEQEDPESRHTQQWDFDGAAPGTLPSSKSASHSPDTADAR